MQPLCETVSVFLWGPTVRTGDWEWSPVGVDQVNLLLSSFKHTHTDRNGLADTCMHTLGYIQALISSDTHTHTHSYSFNLFLFVLGDEQAGRAIRMDGWQAWTEQRNEGTEEMSWWLRAYIIHVGINASFVTVVTSPSISPPALPLLCTGAAMRRCVCVCVCLCLCSNLAPYFVVPIWTTLLFLSVNHCLPVFSRSQWLILPVRWWLSRPLFILIDLLFQPTNLFRPSLHNVLLYND